MKRTREGAAVLAAVVLCALAAMLARSAAGAKVPAAASSLRSTCSRTAPT